MEGLKKRARKATADDALKMTVLRQYALSIEKRSIELYWTDPTIYKKLTKILKRVVSDYKDLAEPYRELNHGKPPDSCDPMVLCRDGTCASPGDCPTP